MLLSAEQQHGMFYIAANLARTELYVTRPRVPCEQTLYMPWRRYLRHNPQWQHESINRYGGRLERFRPARQRTHYKYIAPAGRATPGKEVDVRRACLVPRFLDMLDARLTTTSVKISVLRNE